MPTELDPDELEATLDAFVARTDEDVADAEVRRREGDAFEVRFVYLDPDVEVKGRRFSDLQVVLKERTGWDSTVVGAWLDDAGEAIVVRYELVRWDEDG